MGWTTKTIRKSGKHDIGSFDVFHLILADNHADIWHDMNSSPLVELDYHAHFKCGDSQNKSSSTVPNRWAKLKLHLIGRNVHLRPMLIFNFKAGGCLKLSFVMLQLWECGEIYLEGRGVTSNVWTYLAVEWISKTRVWSLYRASLIQRHQIELWQTAMSIFMTSYHFSTKQLIMKITFGSTVIRFQFKKSFCQRDSSDFGSFGKSPPSVFCSLHPKQTCFNNMNIK